MNSSKFAKIIGTSEKSFKSGRIFIILFDLKDSPAGIGALLQFETTPFRRRPHEHNDDQARPDRTHAITESDEATRHVG
jgi:hypothetical protein